MHLVSFQYDLGRPLLFYISLNLKVHCTNYGLECYKWKKTKQGNIVCMKHKFYSSKHDSCLSLQYLSVVTLFLFIFLIFFRMFWNLVSVHENTSSSMTNQKTMSLLRMKPTLRKSRKVAQWHVCRSMPSTLFWTIGHVCQYQSL